MQNLEERQVNAIFIERFLSDIKFTDQSHSCFDTSNKLMDSINIVKKLGSGKNYYGDAYLVCKPNKFYTSVRDLCQVIFSLKVIAPTASVNEINAMKIFYDDVLSNMYPNLPILYAYRKCKDCTFPSAKMLVVKDGSDAFQHDEDSTPKEYKKTHKVYKGEKIGCNILLTEYAFFGDLENFFKNNKPPVDVTTSLLFQLLTSVYFIQSNYGMEHNDIHQGNALVHAVKEGGVWEYIIDGKSYYIKNYGYLPVLWDFGFAMYPSKDGHKYFPNEFIDTDGYVEGRLPGKNSDAMRIAKTFMSLRRDISIPLAKEVAVLVDKGVYDVSSILSEVFTSYKAHPSGDIIDTFFTSEIQPVEWYSQVSTDDLERMMPTLPPFVRNGFSVHRKWTAKEVRTFKHGINFQLLSAVVDKTEVIEKYLDWFDLRVLSRSKYLPIEVIYERASELDWTALSYFHPLSEDVCLRFKTRVDWRYITDEKIKDWSVGTLISLANYLKWEMLVLENRSVVEIYRLKQFVDWNVLSSLYPVNGHFAIVFRDMLKADLLSMNKNADHDAVYRVAPELVMWELVNPVTLEQVRAHSDEVDWTLVSRTLDLKYVKEFKDKIHWESFWGRNDITATIIKKYAEYLVEGTLVGPLTSVQTTKYKKYINWSEYDCTLLSATELYKNRLLINWGKSTNYTKLMRLSESARTKILGSRNFDWVSVSEYPLPLDVVEKYTSKIKWDIFCNSGVSADTLLEYRERFSMDKLTNYAGFRIFDYLRFDDINWKNVSRFAELHKEHVRALHRVLDLRLLSYKDFDWEFIRKNEEDVNWDTISKLPDLPEEFVQVYFDNLF